MLQPALLIHSGRIIQICQEMPESSVPVALRIYAAPVLGSTFRIFVIAILPDPGDVEDNLPRHQRQLRLAGIGLGRLIGSIRCMRRCVLVCGAVYLLIVLI